MTAILAAIDVVATPAPVVWATAASVASGVIVGLSLGLAGRVEIKEAGYN
jgi:hypothetical protein